MHISTRAVACLGVAALGITASAIADAQTYPSKPIQVISAASLGSAGDIAIRLLAAKLSSGIGQQVLVDTRSGGGGAIAATAAMRAAPDGHTILYATPNILVLNRFMVKNQSYDSVRDFTPLSLSIGISIFLGLNANVPATSMSSLIEFARRNPGSIAHASTGVGTPTHLLAESLKIMTGTDMLHVPYNASGGAVTAMNDLATGRVQIYFPTYSAVRPYLGPNEKIRVLAVFDDARFKLAPNVPAITESLPDFQGIPAYYGLLGPLGMPRPVVERLSNEARKSLAAPDVSGKLEEMGITNYGSTPEEFGARLKKDIDYVGKLLNTLGFKPE